MSLLLSLKTAWSRRNEIILGLLIISLLVIYCLVVLIKGKNALLAARPTIETVVEINTIKEPTVTKEKERRRVAPAAPGCPAIEEIEIEREVTTGREESVSTTKSKEGPVQDPVERRRTRYAGLGVSPLAYTRQWRTRGGMNVRGALDLGVAIDIDPSKIGRDPGKAFDRPMLEATWRF